MKKEIFFVLIGKVFTQKIINKNEGREFWRVSCVLVRRVARGS